MADVEALPLYAGQGTGLTEEVASSAITVDELVAEATPAFGDASAGLRDVAGADCEGASGAE